jgi:biotin transport system permease protein
VTLPSLPARGRVLVRGLPAGFKLVGLAVTATGLLLLSSLPLLLAALAAAALAAGLLLDRRALASSFPPALLVMLGVLGLFTLAIDGPAAAAAVLLRVTTLILLAQIVSATTRSSAIQDAIVRALRPFERLPFVSADKVGLSLAVALRTVPRIEGALHQLREAREARGLRPSSLRLILPLVARILRDARDTADAIDARAWTSNTHRGPLP